jgi:hypothetical protein
MSQRMGVKGEQTCVIQTKEHSSAVTLCLKLKWQLLSAACRQKCSIYMKIHSNYTTLNLYIQSAIGIKNISHPTAILLS